MDLKATMSQLIRTLPSFPHRLPFLHPRPDSLFGVLGFHQLLNINLLRTRQALVEMNRIPCIERLLRHSQRGRAQLEQMIDCALSRLLQLAARPGFIRQAPRGGLLSGESSPGKDHLSSALLRWSLPGELSPE